MKHAVARAGVDPAEVDDCIFGSAMLQGVQSPCIGRLAALRGGINTVLIPEENVKDLAEIPDNVKEGLEIIPVGHVEDVLAKALTKPLEAIEWTEADELAAQAAAPSLGQAPPSPTAH